MKERIEAVKKQLLASDIEGCITGSSMLDANFDEWDTAPDIDVFVYGTHQLVHAVDYVTMVMGFKPGGNGKKPKAEEWKISRFNKGRLAKKTKVATVALTDGEVCVNISYKENQTSVVDVISNFDMSIIMVGQDIETGYQLDLRGDDFHVAKPNPLRAVEYDLFEVAYWIRQFDRVLKYWDRGYDTRPMAEFYIELIDKVLEEGSLFETEASVAMFESFRNEFEEVRAKIAKWLEGVADV